MATDIFGASGVVVERLYNPAGRSSIIGTLGRGLREAQRLTGEPCGGGHGCLEAASVMHGGQGSDDLIECLAVYRSALSSAKKKLAMVGLEVQ